MRFSFVQKKKLFCSKKSDNVQGFFFLIIIEEMPANSETLAEKKVCKRVWREKEEWTWKEKYHTRGSLYNFFSFMRWYDREKAHKPSETGWQQSSVLHDTLIRWNQKAQSKC